MIYSHSTPHRTRLALSRRAAIFAVLSLALATPALADPQIQPRGATPEQQNEFCEQMGKIAASIAHARDSGETREAMLDYIHKNFHGVVAEVPEALVPAVYDHPELNPEQAGDAGVKACHRMIEASETAPPPDKSAPVDPGKSPSSNP